MRSRADFNSHMPMVNTPNSLPRLSGSPVIVWSPRIWKQVPDRITSTSPMIGHSSMASVSASPTAAATDLVGPSPTNTATIADMPSPASESGPATDARARSRSRDRMAGKLKNSGTSQNRYPARRVSGASHIRKKATGTPQSLQIIPCRLDHLQRLASTVLAFSLADLSVHARRTSNWPIGSRRWVTLPSRCSRVVDLCWRPIPG